MSTINDTDQDTLEVRLVRLVDFLNRQAKELRDNAPSDFGYGRGNDHGVAQGYELAAKFIVGELGRGGVA